MSGNVALAMSQFLPDIVLKVLKSRPLHILARETRYALHLRRRFSRAGSVSVSRAGKAINEDFY